jgi:hypothetical protein
MKIVHGEYSYHRSVRPMHPLQIETHILELI